MFYFRGQISLKGLGQIFAMLINLAAFVIIVAGLKAAQSLLVPIFLALFLSLICAPLILWLKRKRIPVWLGVIISLLLLVGFEAVVGTLIGTSLADIMNRLPQFQHQFDQLQSQVFTWLKQRGLITNDFQMIRLFQPARVIPLLTGTLKNFGGMLSNTLFVLLTFVFMLFETGAISLKVRAMVSEKPEALREFNNLLKSINRFIAVKTLTSLATGLLISLWLYILRLDYVLLWGVLAFFLNFIPTIGSFIAAVPAVLFSLLQLGFWKTMLVVVGYLVVNLLIGNVLEPRFMGQTVGLSPLVVFLSMTFWGWVLGPVGMLLSVPLTIIVKIVANTHSQTRWIAILLGTTKEAETLLEQRHNKT